AIQVDPGPELRVLADRDALGILFGNLVENAVKYGKEGGRVEVSLERSGRYATVRVQDDGIGISPEDSQKVFDEFYRARTEQTAAIAGTGLGLSLVKRLAELHEGTVRVQSTLGEGSEFRVDLPLLTY
ncbi:MAG TPA: ATP-binding protein, partial [Spirochaetia bacterium]|nr:ATP-binding protein [Spirochaetia bacterium]